MVSSKEATVTSINKNKKEKVPKSPGATAQLVNSAFEFFKLSIKSDGMIYDKKGNMVENPRDFVETYHDFNPDLPCEKRYFDSQIRNLIKEKRETERARLIETLAVCEPDPDNNLDKFCREMLFGTDFETPEGKKMLEVFKWSIESIFIQIKRKMKKLRIFDHKVIVLIGCGTEGDQKTESVKMLLSPLDCLFNTVTVAEIADWSRNYPRFSEHYGLLCDELSNAGSNKSESETVKMVLTSDFLSPRKLSKQMIIKVPNNSTTVATSNLPICEIFKENSSIRRFQELFVTVNPKRYLTLKSINFDKLFKSVKFEFTQDEIENYLDNMRNLIVPLQKESVFKDIVDEFMEENMVEKGSDFFSSSELHQELIQYIDHKRYNIKRPSIQSFGRLLNKKYDILSYRSSTGDGKGYYINKPLFFKNRKRAPDHKYPS